MGDKTQFVWFVGHSAVGKQTAIRKCLDGDPRLRSLLGLGASASVKQVPVTSAEAVCPEPGVDCLLMKWQNATKDAVRSTKQAWPDAKHVVVHLHRGVAEHLQSFKAKYPTRHGDEKATERTFHEHKHANQLACEAYRGVVDRYIDIAVIDGSYHVI